MNTEGQQDPGVGPEERAEAVHDDVVVDDETVNEPEAVTAQHQIIDHLPEQLEEATIHWHAVGEFLGSALSALRGGDGWDDEQSPGHEDPDGEDDPASDRPEDAPDGPERPPAH